jgi:hypothetical protein
MMGFGCEPGRGHAQVELRPSVRGRPGGGPRSKSPYSATSAAASEGFKFTVLRKQDNGRAGQSTAKAFQGLGFRGNLKF